MTAAAPPSAETVWLRIGYTFEITATLSCGLFSATAIAARRPAPPPPTTSTSQLKRSMLLDTRPSTSGSRLIDRAALRRGDAYERDAPGVFLTADGSKRPGVYVGSHTKVTAGEDERSENPNQGHPAPSGIGRFTRRISGSIFLQAGGPCQHGSPASRGTLRSCKTLL